MRACIEVKIFTQSNAVHQNVLMPCIRTAPIETNNEQSEIRFKGTKYLQKLKWSFSRGAFKLSESGFYNSKLKKLTSKEQKPYTSMCVSMCINMYTVRKSFQGNKLSAKTEMVIFERSLQAFRIWILYLQTQKIDF